MIHRPRFTAHLHAQPLSNTSVVLVSQVGYTVLDGHVFRLVAPLIDGRRSVDEIVEQLHPHLSSAEVYYAVALLEQRGFVRENDAADPPRGEEGLS